MSFYTCDDCKHWINTKVDKGIFGECRLTHKQLKRGQEACYQWERWY